MKNISNLTETEIKSLVCDFMLLKGTQQVNTVNIFGSCIKHLFNELPIQTGNQLKFIANNLTTDGAAIVELFYSFIPNENKKLTIEELK